MVWMRWAFAAVAAAALVAATSANAASAGGGSEGGSGGGKEYKLSDDPYAEYLVVRAGFDLMRKCWPASDLAAYGWNLREIERRAKHRMKDVSLGDARDWAAKYVARKGCADLTPHDLRAAPELAALVAGRLGAQAYDLRSAWSEDAELLRTLSNAVDLAGRCEEAGPTRTALERARTTVRAMIDDYAGEAMRKKLEGGASAASGTPDCSGAAETARSALAAAKRWAEL